MSPEVLQQGQFHLPVLAERVAEFLATETAKVIVDATLGDGGHSLALVQRGSPELRLIGIDVDPQSLEAAQLRLKDYSARCSLVKDNFRHLSNVLDSLSLPTVDGIVADLGVSSRQIDVPERGFSYLGEGPLDLRLDPSIPGTAAELLAALEQDELVRLLRDYGEEKLARPIAKAIVRQRRTRAIRSTADLRTIIEGVVRGPHRVKSLARVFQALRIAVNDELGALQEFLEQATARLHAGGRLAVISYHSLEDRAVKQHFRRLSRDCICPPEFPVCVCGKTSEAVELTRRPVTPDEAEIAQNPRARSARLRVLQKR